MLHDKIGLLATEVTETVSLFFSNLPDQESLQSFQSEDQRNLDISSVPYAPLHRPLDQRHPDIHRASGDTTYRHEPVYFHAVHDTQSSPDSSVLDEHYATEDEAHFERFQTVAGWNRTATNGSLIQSGQPITLTWSIATDGSVIPGFAGEDAADSNLKAFLDGVYDNGNGINDEQDIWLPMIASAFDRWSELGGVNFVFETQDDGGEFSNFSSINPGILGTRGDIRIGGHAIDGNSETLGYNFSPGVGEMILDTSDNAFSRNINSPIWFRNLIAHELGHALGLSHVSSSDADFLLEASITTQFEGPQLDDILGLHRLYGDALESADGIPTQNNDAIATATNLGVLNVGESITRGSDAIDGVTLITRTQTDFVSIDDETDIDVYRFSLNHPTLVDITLSPRGATYSQSGQLWNTKALSDLSLELLAQNGQVLATSNETGLGAQERIASFQILEAGDYFVQVTGADDNVQLYELELAAQQSSGLTLIGDNDINIFSGNDGDDTLLGYGGRDRLLGGLGNDSLDGGSGNDFLRGGQGADYLQGGFGIDIVDYFGSTGINLTLGTSSATGGDAEGDTLVSFERVYGSLSDDQITGDTLMNLLWGRSGSDTIRGGAGNDIIRGGLGADRLDGETGTDAADYIGSTSAVTVNLLTGDNRHGEAEGDILLNFERVYGSQFDDHMTGDRAANLLWGRSGRDTIHGGSGNDIIRGGIDGDILDGGTGADILDYTTSDTGVSVNLETGVVSGGDAAGDSITNFERVYGSKHGDRLTGDSRSNLLQGRKGADTLSGGSGNDVIRGGVGADVLDGGDGVDIVDYSDSRSGVMVDLDQGTVSGGDAQGDTIINFERINGSIAHDRLTGDASGNNLNGRNGNDTLVGGGGRDTLLGGNGADTFVIRRLEDSLIRGRDWIRDFEIGTDQILTPAAVVAQVPLQFGEISTFNSIGIQETLTAETFMANGVATFTHRNRTFLILNDAVDGYQSPRDSLIDITGYRGNLSDLSLG